MQAKAGLEVSGLGLFSASIDVTYAQRYLSQRSSYHGFSTVEKLATIYQVGMLPSFLLPLDSNFEQSVKHYFDGDFNQNNFDDFVKYFGTHYIISATFGGKAIMKSAVAASYADFKYTS